MNKFLTVLLALTLTQPIFAQSQATPVSIPGYTPPATMTGAPNSEVTTTATPNSTPMPTPEVPTSIPSPSPSYVPSPTPTEVPLPTAPTPQQAPLPAPTEPAPAPHFTPELPPANQVREPTPPGVNTPMPKVPTTPVLTPPPSQISTPVQTPVPTVPPTSVPTPVPEQTNPPIVNPLPSPSALMTPNFTTSLVNLMRCKPTNITKKTFPAGLSKSYENLSGKILGWENNRCHLVINISLKNTSLGENQNTIRSECFLTKTTLQNFYSALLNYIRLETHESKTALLNAFKDYMKECTTTIRGSRVRFF